MFFAHFWEQRKKFAFVSDEGETKKKKTETETKMSRERFGRESGTQRKSGSQYNRVTGRKRGRLAGLGWLNPARIRGWLFLISSQEKRTGTKVNFVFPTSCS